MIMKVAVYFATGYEEVEALSVVDVLRRGDVEVIMAGVGSKTVESSRKISINMDTTVDAINIDELDMIVLPGGIPGVPNLAADPNVVEHVKAFRAQNKWLAAICAAPSLLGNFNLLAGEKATCYPGFEDKLLGATHINEGVVVSNKVITAQAAGYSLDFAIQLLEVLQGKEIADKVAEGMLVKRA